MANIDKDILNNADKAFIAQKHQLDSAANRVSKLQVNLEKTKKLNKNSSEKLLRLENELENIETLIDENNCHYDDKAISKDELLGLTDEENSIAKNSVAELELLKPLEVIDTSSNWDDYVKNINFYIKNNNITITEDPLAQLFTNKQYIEIDKKFKANFIKDKWDKWDYAFVGTAGFIAALTDFFIVKIPKTIKYRGVEQKGSALTEFLKNNINSEKGNNSWFAQWANNLEDKCKVPYDAVKNGLQGMGGRTHRLQSLGHDPVLGLIFGVIDILKGNLTGFSYDTKTGIHSIVTKNIAASSDMGIINAFLMQLGHLISDVGTTMGIPPPFFTLFQGLNFKLPGGSKNIGAIARWMYFNGYDFRHFITMSITPACIEIILRAYLMLRHYHEKKEVKFLLTGIPKYRSMLLASHAIACAANAGKVYLYQGNPLAINYAEWLTMIRYLIPQIKYWLFDKKRLELRKIDDINLGEWQELCQGFKIDIDQSFSHSLKEISLK